MTTVKQSRQEQAAATRQRILDTAYDLFCELGYRGTTMTLIAERAGVAVQTVYFTFRTKDALLQEVHDQTVLGRDAPAVPMRQPWYVGRASPRPDPVRATRLLVEGIATILARVAPMLPVFHAVVADPAGEVYRNAEALRRPAMYDVAREILLTKAPARPGVDARQAGDLLVVLLGPEIYRMYVLELGWSQERWVDWTTQVIVPLSLHELSRRLPGAVVAAYAEPHVRAADQDRRRARRPRRDAAAPSGEQGPARAARPGPAVAGRLALLPGGDRRPRTGPATCRRRGTRRASWRT